MKFRFTENTFFDQKERNAGDVMEAPTGPYKFERGPDGKMQRLPLFQVIEEAKPMADPVVPPPNVISTAAANPLPAGGAVTGWAPQVTLTVDGPKPLPKPAPVADPIKKTITGAGALGAAFKDRIAKSMANVAAAKSQLTGALDDIDGASASAVNVAKALQAEADDLKASIGQVSNE